MNAGKGDKEVAFYSYDDIGRLVSGKRSGNAGTVTNEYNIRNWLVSTSSDRFMESLKYESGSETPCYNGNISRMQWQNTYDNVLRGYDFEYDGQNRLTASAYAEGTDMSQTRTDILSIFLNTPLMALSNACRDMARRTMGHLVSLTT